MNVLNFLSFCLSKLHRDDGSVDKKWNDLIILIINTWIDIVCENGQEMENVSQLEYLSSYYIRGF